MKTCFGCGLDAVDPAEPARYDVLKPGADPDEEPDGPYCATCFASTATGLQVPPQSGAPS